ncbi:MAG: hypothetical protein Q4B80_00645 [Aerococcaceae bacterium]|nr:hypothetical protein [Aerococcaceae bacterium]
MTKEELVVEELNQEDTIVCCDSDSHVVTSEEEFQELLKGLHSEGKF